MEDSQDDDDDINDNNVALCGSTSSVYNIEVIVLVDAIVGCGCVVLVIIEGTTVSSMSSLMRLST